MKFLSNLKKLLLSLPSRQDLNWALKSFDGVNRSSQLKQNILFCDASGVTQEKYEGGDLIVSLTTFGERINFVALAIESIMEQTLKPNRIVLWLDRSFESGGGIPMSLKLLQKRGLEIMFCDDIGPHTKLIPSLKAFPDALIVTIDDDCAYDYDLLDCLYREHLKKPDAICAMVLDDIADKYGNILPTENWGADKCSKDYVNPMPLGVGGILYPPHSLAQEATDVERIKELCPKADDIWFNAMTIKKGTPVSKAYSPSYKNYQLIGYIPSLVLEKYNVYGGGNMAQLKAVYDYYELWPKLKKC